MTTGSAGPGGAGCGGGAAGSESVPSGETSGICAEALFPNDKTTAHDTAAALASFANISFSTLTHCFLGVAP